MVTGRQPRPAQRLEKSDQPQTGRMPASDRRKSIPPRRVDKLVKLNLRRTQVTDKGVAWLAKALPKCKVEWDGSVIDPAPRIDPDRRAAEFVLSIGGIVNINDKAMGRLRGRFAPESIPIDFSGTEGGQAIEHTGDAVFDDCRN